MGLLYFNDLLKNTGLDASKVLLIRHALSNPECLKFCKLGQLKEYTQIQNKKRFPKDFNYWITFKSDNGTSAILDKCYEVKGYQENTTNLVPKGITDPKWFSDNGICFDLQEIDLLQEYEGRLVIEWGKGAINWYQPATNEKEVIAIQSKQKVTFTGYENLLLTYDELKEIVADNLTYADWHTALSSIYAVYLIVDKTDGKQYIGSAYGTGGLFERWSMYVNTKHGNNVKMKNLICDCPKRYHSFQFSILQICPKSVTAEQMIHLESLYKRKLLTKEFGLNNN